MSNVVIRAVLFRLRRLLSRGAWARLAVAVLIVGMGAPLVAVAPGSPVPAIEAATVRSNNCGRNLFDVLDGGGGNLDMYLRVESLSAFDQMAIVYYNVTWLNLSNNSSGFYTKWETPTPPIAERSFLNHGIGTPSQGLVTATVWGWVWMTNGKLCIIETNSANVGIGIGHVDLIPITGDLDGDDVADDEHCDSCDKKQDQMNEVDQANRVHDICDILPNPSTANTDCRHSGNDAWGAREGRGWDCWYGANRSGWRGATAPENDRDHKFAEFFLPCGFQVPTLTVSPTTILPGQAVTLTWANIPAAAASDWIAGYMADTGNLADPPILKFPSSGCGNTAGANGTANGSCQITMPLIGRYIFRLRHANGLAGVVARSSNLLTVGGIVGDPGPTPTPGPAQPPFVGMLEYPGSVRSETRMQVIWGGINASYDDLLILYKNDGTIASPSHIFATGGDEYASHCETSASSSRPARPDGSCSLAITVGPGTYFWKLRKPNGTLLAQSSQFTVVAAATATPVPPTPTNTPTPGNPAISSVHVGDLSQDFYNVTWSGVQNPTSSDWFVLYKSDGSLASPTTFRFTATCGTSSSSSNPPKASGTCTNVSLAALPAGNYFWKLRANGGSTVLATSNTFAVN